ncbi:MAG: zf-HC2 domain-containing protein [Chloroflexi bacterium]|nr:zf-HC2 domain-containing protein [Chloroflexota bacterium]
MTKATMANRHVTHLIARYVQGQLGPEQRAQVMNHVRFCARCRVALAREEQIAAELQREMPRLGQPDPAQMDRVWAGVWQEVQAPRPPARTHRAAGWPGLSMALAVLLMITLALPLVAQRGMRAEAAPIDTGANLVRSTASPPPAGTVVARNSTPEGSATRSDARATVALAAPTVGASPVPMPVSTVFPDAPTDAASW